MSVYYEQGEPDPKPAINYTVRKYEAVTPVPESFLGYAVGGLVEQAFIADRILNREPETPEQRAARKAKAITDRIEERSTAERVPLTVETLAKRLGLGPRFAEHLVQPYCDCWPETDGGGWSLCAHAEDEGLQEDR